MHQKELKNIIAALRKEEADIAIRERKADEQRQTMIRLREASVQNFARKTLPNLSASTLRHLRDAYPEFPIPFENGLLQRILKAFVPWYAPPLIDGMSRNKLLANFTEYLWEESSKVDRITAVTYFNTCLRNLHQVIYTDLPESVTRIAKKIRTLQRLQLRDIKTMPEPLRSRLDTAIVSESHRIREGVHRKRQYRDCGKGPSHAFPTDTSVGETQYSDLLTMWFWHEILSEESDTNVELAKALTDDRPNSLSITANS